MGIKTNALPFITELDNRLSKKLSYKEKQSELLAKFYYKLTTKQNVTVVTQGDSLTYGHDTTSADKKAADTVRADNGTAHSFTRAAVTYPEQLQANLRAVYGNTSTVINKGYSGDYADLSYQRWNRNDNADAAILMLGTNDASNDSYIPVIKQRNVEAYLQDMRNIVQRFLEWNTPVFLIAPPRTQQPESASTNARFIEPFRNALHGLGEEFGCPVIDMEEFCNGLDNTYYSDALHFNGKGYTYLANRLTTVFVGFLDTPRISPKSVIGIRHTRDNLVLNNVTVSNATNSDSAEEGAINGSSLLATINPGSSMHLSFYSENDNLVLLPIHGLVSGATAKYTLDGGSPQGSVPLLSAINRKYDERMYPPSVITSLISTNGTQTYDGSITPAKTSDHIHITNKGYHTIKVENGAAAGSVLFQGFVVISYKDFISGETFDDAVYMPVLGGTTTAGTHTYTKRISKIRRVGCMVYHHVTMTINVDNTIAGSVYVALKFKPENITDLKIHVPIYQGNGMFNDATLVNGMLFANNSLMYLQKVVNGVGANLNGSELQGKTIDLTFTAVYSAT